MSEYENFFEEVAEALEDIAEIFYYGNGIAELSFAAIFLIVMLGVLLFVGLLLLVQYILTAIPVYKLAKKLNIPNAGIAWIPFVSTYCHTYLLCSMSKEKDLILINNNEKYKIKDRKQSFLYYVLIGVCGNIVISLFITVASFVPIVGTFVSVFGYFLYYIPAIALAVMNYAYLRDVINIFKPDRNANSTTAIIITVLDSFITIGFARAFYIFKLTKLEPISEPEVTV